MTMSTTGAHVGEVAVEVTFTQLTPFTVAVTSVPSATPVTRNEPEASVSGSLSRTTVPVLAVTV